MARSRTATKRSIEGSATSTNCTTSEDIDSPLAAERRERTSWERRSKVMVIRGFEVDMRSPVHHSEHSASPESPQYGFSGRAMALRRAAPLGNPREGLVDGLDRCRWLIQEHGRFAALGA